MQFIGRERDLDELNRMYQKDTFQMFILYGRRRVGKTTFLSEFCKGKPYIFFSAEQSSNKLNLDKFSEQVFQYYGEQALEPFASWTNALSFIDERQKKDRLVLVLDEFPYLAQKNRALLSELQHFIDHRLQKGKLFLVLCGSYMGFMEKEVLGSKSPLFGRRTGQLHMKVFDYLTSLKFLEGFSSEEKLELYGAFGGTPLYLSQVQSGLSFEENIKRNFLTLTSYLYEEPVLLLQQEVQEPGIYSAIMEAIAGGASKANEISTKIGEESAKCLKYIRTLCELGILYKETPYGEKDSSRKTLYRICDFMFRFWYRYVFANRTLVETGAYEAVWKQRILPDYSNYMGIVFEKVCRDFLMAENAKGELPFLFTSIGRWWGANAHSARHEQVEIDLVAKEGGNYLFGECKWRNEKMGESVLTELREKADVFSLKRDETWYVLFSKSGFTKGLQEKAKREGHVRLVGLEEICR